MDDLNAMIGSILNDPQKMEQLRAVAQSLGMAPNGGGGNAAANTGQQPAANNASTPAQGGIDPAAIAQILQNFQNATWFDLGYPEKIGSAGNYMLRTDLGFNRRYDCIVLHEVVSPVGALAHNPLRVIDGTKYIIEEFSFYDNFSRFGEGNRYFVSSNGYIIYTERLYEEDYLFNATQFDSTTPYYSKLIKAIKKINHID